MTFTKLTTEIEARGLNLQRMRADVRKGTFDAVEYLEQGVLPWNQATDPAKILALVELLTAWRDCALYGTQGAAVTKTMDIELKILEGLEP